MVQAGAVLRLAGADRVVGQGRVAPCATSGCRKTAGCSARPAARPSPWPRDAGPSNSRTRASASGSGKVVDAAPGQLTDVPLELPDGHAQSVDDDGLLTRLCRRASCRRNTSFRPCRAARACTRSSFAVSGTAARLHWMATLAGPCSSTPVSRSKRPRGYPTFSRGNRRAPSFRLQMPSVQHLVPREHHRDVSHVELAASGGAGMSAEIGGRERAEVVRDSAPASPRRPPGAAMAWTAGSTTSHRS